MENINDHMPLSHDWNQERLEKLKELFPDLFTNEGQLNIDELKKVIDPQSVNETERYEFRWFGKSAAKRNAFTPSNATLQYDESRSVNPDKSENLIIEGENLEVLKLLSDSYREKIKFIYIDPPYNTGGDFVYSDNYNEEKKPYWEQTEITENGVKIDTNIETNGRYHSNWLDMMFSRLLLARTMLSKDGAIFISIDENEEHHLRKLLDEVFGEENFVEKIVWNKRIPKNDKGIGNIHEYILLYVKDASLKHKFKMPKDGIKEVYDFVEILKKKKIPIDQAEKELKKYYQLKGYDRGITLYCNLDSEYRIWGKINLSWPNAKDGPRYDVLHPITKNPVAVPDNGWRYTKTTFDDYLDYEKIVHRADNSYVCGRIWFGNNEKTQPSFIQYLDNVTDFLLRSVISLKSSGGKEFNDLMPKVNFSHPKTYKLISRLLSTIDGKDYTILDFFAGSGTTGHAVAEMNKLDNGNRKFILVQIPEKVDEKHSAFKEGYKKISDITIERNKRVIEKIIEEKKSAKPDLFTGEQKEEALTGLGFKVFKLVKSNFPRVEFAPDPEKSDGENLNLLKKYITEKEAQLVNAFNRDELITEILLKNGFNLNYRIEKWEQFKKNDIYLATDGEKETLMCLDYVLDPETVNYFKSHKETKFICLERALDTTKKYSLKQYLGNMFNAF